MPFQVVCRVVCRADDFDVGLFDQALDAHIFFLQLGVAAIEDIFSILFAQRFGNAEIALQFQMTPMIERIANSSWKSFRIFDEFFQVCRFCTGNFFFRCPIGTDEAPFIMVTAEPYFSNAAEVVIFCDFLRGNMAMVVNNRHMFCIVVE